MQRIVFPWIGYDDPFKSSKFGVPPHKVITPEEIVKKHGVPREELQRYIENEIQESEMFRSMPFTMFFVIAYACLVLIHNDAVVVRAVEQSIEVDIIDNARYGFDARGIVGTYDVMDVDNAEEYWMWLIEGLLPLIAAQELPEGVNMSDPDVLLQFQEENRQGIYLNYNRILGGVRLEQERAEPKLCSHASALLTWYHGDCYGDAYEVDPETWTARQVTPADRVEWLFISEPAGQIRDHVMTLRDEGWIDAATRKIKMSIPVYTGEFGLHSLITINFFFSRGGKVWKQFLHLSVFAFWYTHWWYVIYDILWGLALMRITIAEVTEVAWYCKRKPLKALYLEYIGFWNFVDWVSIFAGGAIMLLAYLSVGGTNRLNSETENLSAASLADGEAHREQVMLYYSRLDQVSKYMHAYRLVLASYPLVIVLRLFKAFAAQPRLALVTETLLVSGVDIMHFLIVFVSIFITFAISGLVLFGHRNENFTTFPRAINMVFKLLLGDFDWETLRRDSHMEAFIWLAMTIGILVLLLLNMVLAIVIDGYGRVKRRMFISDTLYTEMHQTVQRFLQVRRGKWVDLHTILNALLDMEREMHMRGQGHHHATAKAKGQYLVGRDCKPMVHARVIPKDEDIRKFVREGVIEKVGRGMLKVRVKHRDGRVREYDTGHDFNYELMLADGEDPVEIEEEDTTSQVHHVVSPERLMKVVSSYDKMFRLSYHQAFDLCMWTVQRYYNKHTIEVDMDNLVELVRQQKSRVKTAALVVTEGTCQKLKEDTVDGLHSLRRYLQALHQTMDEERQTLLTDIRSERRKVRDLERRLREEQGLQQDPAEVMTAGVATVPFDVGSRRASSARLSVYSRAPSSHPGSSSVAASVAMTHNSHMMILDSVRAMEMELEEIPSISDWSDGSIAELTGRTHPQASPPQESTVSDIDDEDILAEIALNMTDEDLVAELDAALDSSAAMRQHGFLQDADRRYIEEEQAAALQQALEDEEAEARRRRRQASVPHRVRLAPV